MTKVNSKRDSKIFQLLWYVDPGLSKNMWTWLLKSGCIYSITLHGDLSSTTPLFLCFFVPILSNTSHHNHHRNKRLSQYIKVEKYFFLHNNARISHSPSHTEEIISLCNVQSEIYFPHQKWPWSLRTTPIRIPSGSSHGRACRTRSQAQENENLNFIF